MMMFDNNMNTVDFQVSTNEGITGRSQMSANSDSTKDVVRRVSDNSATAEETNMFTKVSNVIDPVGFPVSNDFDCNLTYF